MVAILQLAVHLYHQDQNLGNVEWASVRKQVLSELGLHEHELPELIDVVLENYNSGE